MITMVVGNPGNGKGVYAAWLLKNLREQGFRVATNLALTDRHPYYSSILSMDQTRHECPIYRHFPRNGNRWRAIHPEIAHMLQYCEVSSQCEAYWHYLWGWVYPKGVKTPAPWHLVIDEADKIFPAQQKNSLDSEVNWYFSQHRKWGHDLYLITQRPEQLFTRIRSLTDRVVECEFTLKSCGSAFAYLPKSWARFVRHSYSNLQRKGEPEESTSMGMSEASQVFTWFRTDQLTRVV